MDKNITTNYKNTEVVVIVEDDLITTAQVFVGNECINRMEIATKSNPDGVPFTEKNYDSVMKAICTNIDKALAKAVA